MNRLRNILAVLVTIEILVTAGLCGRRLASIQPLPPPVELYTDAITGSALLALPDQFLFDSVDKWRVLGEAYMVAGFFSKAEACLQQAVECQPGAADIALSHGHCLERLGILDQARDEYRRAATRGHLEVAETAWYCLGRTFLQLDKPIEAQEALERAGNHMPSIYLRARLLVRERRALEAEPLLEQLAGRHPDDLRVWQLRARAAELLGQIEEAFDARETAERSRVTLDLNERPHLKAIFPEFGFALRLSDVRNNQLTGRTQVAADDMLELTRDETHCVDIQPTILQEAAAYQLELGNGAHARRLLERQIVREGYPTPRAWELLGFVELKEKHSQRAWQNWDRAELMLPGSVDRSRLADTLEQTGDLSAAQTQRPLALQAAGIKAYRSNDLPAAASALQKATSLDRDLSDAWFYLGRTERLLGNRTAAESALRNCLKLHPEHGRAQIELDRLTIPSPKP